MFKSVKKTIASIALAMGLSACITSSANAESDANLPLKGTTLRVSIALSAPFVEVGDEGLKGAVGIDVDLIHELQRRTGFTLEDNRINIMNSKQLEMEAADGTSDILGGGLYLTEERSAMFAFSDPYYRTHISVISRNCSGIKGLNDLSGRSVAVVDGSTAKDQITTSNISSVKTVDYPTNFMAFYAANYGLTDTVMADAPLADDFMEHLLGDKLQVCFAVPNTEAMMGLLFKKRGKQHTILQNAIRDMIIDGTAAKIVSAYAHHEEDNMARVTYDRVKWVESL